MPRTFCKPTTVTSKKHPTGMLMDQHGNVVACNREDAMRMGAHVITDWEKILLIRRAEEELKLRKAERARRAAFVAEVDAQIAAGNEDMLIKIGQRKTKEMAERYYADPTLWTPENDEFMKALIEKAESYNKK